MHMLKSLALAFLLTACAGGATTSTSRYAPPPTFAARFIHREVVTPGEMHLGIVRDVGRVCFGLDASASEAVLDSIVWSVADTIIVPSNAEVPTAFLAYGLTQLEIDEESREVLRIHITIERAHWWNPSPISHEAWHARSRNMSHPDAVWSCTMPTSWPMPLRLYPSVEGEA